VSKVLEHESVLDEVFHKRLLADISAVRGVRLGEVDRPTR
jgi:hypothetical protein